MSRRHRGYSLVEVVVVIAILAIVALLTIAAVQSSREAARRVTCASNLKGVGLALGNYTSAHNAFPGGGNGLGYSYLASLLPYLDQAPLFNSINFGFSATMTGPGSENFTVAATGLAMLLCPSDPLRSPTLGPTTNDRGQSRR